MVVTVSSIFLCHIIWDESHLIRHKLSFSQRHKTTSSLLIDREHIFLLCRVSNIWQKNKNHTTYISENDVSVGEVKRYRNVIKISQLIENHKITVKREANSIRYTEQRKLKLSKIDLSQLLWVTSCPLECYKCTNQNLENSNELVRELLKSVSSITEWVINWCLPPMLAVFQLYRGVNRLFSVYFIYIFPKHLICHKVNIYYYSSYTVTATTVSTGEEQQSQTRKLVVCL
jgi:hypothetical protein